MNTGRSRCDLPFFWEDKMERVDGDFASAVHEVKARGKQVEVAFFGKPAWHLRDVCDKYVDLNKKCADHFKKSE